MMIDVRISIIVVAAEVVLAAILMLSPEEWSTWLSGAIDASGLRELFALIPAAREYYSSGGQTSAVTTLSWGDLIGAYALLNAIACVSFLAFLRPDVSAVRAQMKSAIPGEARAKRREVTAWASAGIPFAAVLFFLIYLTNPQTGPLSTPGVFEFSLEAHPENIVVVIGLSAGAVLSFCRGAVMCAVWWSTKANDARRKQAPETEEFLE